MQIPPYFPLFVFWNKPFFFFFFLTSEISNQCSPYPCYKEGSLRCVDGQASFTCVCKPGWKGQRCEDGQFRNTKYAGLHGHTWQHTPPYFCENGWRLLSCDRADINECLDPEFPAGCNQKCTNIPGSFQCQCESGYFSINRITCVGKTPLGPAVFIVLFMCRGTYRALEQLSKHVSEGCMTKHDITERRCPAVVLVGPAIPIIDMW